MSTHRRERPWPGRFIVLEGIDGSGTTTQSVKLAEMLQRDGIDARVTCEPTPGPVGALIRQALQGKLTRPETGECATLGSSTLALLFAADRLDHVDSFILPALRSGATVISDRYDLSSLIYQSVTSADGDGSLEWLRHLNARAPRPDLTVVLDIDPDVAAERRRGRGGTEELFEALELQRRLASVYARAETLLPEDRIAHVPSDGSVDEVAGRLYRIVTGVE